MNFKRWVIFLVFIFFTLNETHASIQNKILIIEKSTTVIFAQPEFRGTTRLQVFTNGSIEWVDNKNKVTQIVQNCPNP